MKKDLIKILFIGDIVGKPGRAAAKLMILKLKKKENVDLVLANGENLASGKGITFAKYQEMIEAGIDYFTSGNHVWNNKEIIEHLKDSKVKILRPDNYPNSCPGRGIAALSDNIILANLQGRVFMKDEVSDPFVSAKNIANEYHDKIIIIDFHAEATSEKIALGYYLDGEVAAVLGTHTHVQTADEKIMPKGTAYITDIGMTGPSDSVLGVKKEIIIEKFLTQLPKSHKVAKGEMIFCAVLLNINTKTKKVLEIKRIQKIISSN